MERIEPKESTNPLKKLMPDQTSTDGMRESLERERERSVSSPSPASYRKFPGKSPTWLKKTLTKKIYIITISCKSYFEYFYFT